MRVCEQRRNSRCCLSVSNEALAGSASSKLHASAFILCALTEAAAIRLDFPDVCYKYRPANLTTTA
jgi:hypothetical protein